MVEKRGLKHQSAGDESDAALHAKLFRHLVFHGHVEHRCQTAAIVGGDVAFVQGGVFHYIVVKYGEETEEMRGIVDGRAV